MSAVLPDAELRTWKRSDGGTPQEAMSGADVVCTCTSAREPIVRRDWLAPGAHVNAVGSSIKTTRELDTATVADASLFVDRRESTLNESGDYLIPAAEGAIGPDHILAELGEVLVGHPSGPHLGRRADGLQVARHRRRGPGGGRARRRERARARHRHRGRVLS